MKSRTFPATRVFLLLVGLLVLILGRPASAATLAPITVLVEGAPLEMDAPPVIVDGRTLIGVRFVGEAVGGTVKWDPDSRTATVTSGEETVEITIGAQEALVNGQPVTMEVPAQLVESRTMVPLRFIAEALGATVEWDEGTRTVNILRKPAAITGMTYQTTGGRTQVRLTLSAPLLSIQPFTEGNSVYLDLYPAVIAVADPERPIYDGLTQSIRLRPGGRTARLEAALWDVPIYRYDLSPDGRELTLEFDPMVRSVQYHEEGRSPQVTIATTGEVEYRVEELQNPPRLVVDLEDALPGPNVPATLAVDSAAVTAIRTAPRGGSGTRVVLDLPQDAAYDIVSTSLGLEIRLMPQLLRVETEQFSDRTRLTLVGSLPLDANVAVQESLNRLLIELPQGRSALASSRIQVNEGAVKTVTVSEGAVPNALLVAVDLPYYLGHTVISRDGDDRVVVDLINSPVYGKRIWIDAGHGRIPGANDDPGSIGRTYGTLEKEVNLEVALALQQKLEAAGAIVYMTRTGDEGVDFRDRPALVNGVNPPVDLFVSIHHNSLTSPSVRGIETYYWTTNPQSHTLAQQVHAAVVAALGFPDRGVRMNDFYVIKATVAPSILVELGYLSNPDEERAVAEPGTAVRRYPGKAADGIFQGIVDFCWQEFQ